MGDYVGNMTPHAKIVQKIGHARPPRQRDDM